MFMRKYIHLYGLLKSIVLIVEVCLMPTWSVLIISLVKKSSPHTQA